MSRQRGGLIVMISCCPQFSHDFPLPVRPSIVQEVAPHMMRQRGGLIVMIGSVTAHMASPFAGAYSASKAALLALSDSLRLELQPFGVQVSYVTAGSIRQVGYFGWVATGLVVVGAAAAWVAGVTCTSQQQPGCHGCAALLPPECH